MLLSGEWLAVAFAVKAALSRDETATILTFDDQTGRLVDFDLRGQAEIAARLVPRAQLELADVVTRKAGRPRLGVVSREVNAAA